MRRLERRLERRMERVLERMERMERVLGNVLQGRVGEGGWGEERRCVRGMLRGRVLWGRGRRSKTLG